MELIMKRNFSILILLMATVAQAFGVSYVYNPQTKNVSVSWVYDEKIGVLTESNTEIIHWLTEGGKNTCSASAFGWNLVPNSKYYAYAPYSQSYLVNKDPMTALPVSYASQSQTENNSMGHLSAYDFMTSKTTSTNSSCKFDYNHVGSILRIECQLAENKPLSAITISSEGNKLFTEAKMNVTDGKLTPTAYASGISLMLNDMSIEEGEKLVAYMMVPAMDLTDEELTVTLTAADGTMSKAEMKGTRITAGHLYPIALEMPSFETEDNEGGESGDSGDTPGPLLAKRSIAAQEETSISSITVSVPDFIFDSTHQFEQIVGLLGDVNGDGKVMVSDAVMLVNHYLYGTTSQLNKRTADANQDGKITIADAVAIINIYLYGK